MSAPTTPAKASATTPAFCPLEWAKKHAEPYLVPYYLTVFAVLGAATTGLVVVILLLILVVSNFSAIGFVE
jgi:hypothetical protein